MAPITFTAAYDWSDCQEFSVCALKKSNASKIF